MSKRLPALTVVRGSEPLLVERAVNRIVGAVLGQQPGTEVMQYSGAELSAGPLADALSPSLFATHRAVVVSDVHDVADDVAAVISAYAGDPADDTWLVATHPGGPSDRKPLVKALAAAGAAMIDCPAPKPWQRADFVLGEFAAAGREATKDAAAALIETVGTDLRDLAAACSQLLSDTDGRINAGAVARYYRGRAAASGFGVADRMLDGDLSGAIAEYRFALAAGSSPVAITGALASSLRTVIRVAAAGRDTASLADLKVPSWRVDRARKQAARWHPDALSYAVQVIADADAAAKGAAADANYAVERALIEISNVRETR